jgi:hypothetical protein
MKKVKPRASGVFFMWDASGGETVIATFVLDKANSGFAQEGRNRKEVRAGVLSENKKSSAYGGASRSLPWKGAQ